MPGPHSSYSRNPKTATGGVGAAVGSNPEYRHDKPGKSRNPTTRGPLPTPERGATPRRITTPSGEVHRRRMIERLRNG